MFASISVLHVKVCLVDFAYPY